MTLIKDFYKDKEGRVKPIKYHEERITIQNAYRHYLTTFIREKLDEDMSEIWFLTFLLAMKNIDYDGIRDIIVYDEEIRKLTRKIRIRSNFIDKDTLVLYFTRPTNFLSAILSRWAIRRLEYFLSKFGLFGWIVKLNFLLIESDEIIGRIDYVIDDYSANVDLLKYFIIKNKNMRKIDLKQGNYEILIDFLRTANPAKAAMIISNRREFFPSEEEHAPAPSA